MCFCYVQRRMSTHKQSNVQTNRRHPRLSLVSQQKQMRSVFRRNSTHYSDDPSSVSGNCCYKWIRGNKWLHLEKRPQCANESHNFGLNATFCVCMCVQCFFVFFCFCYIFIFVLFTRALNKAFIHSVFGRKKQRLTEQSNARFLNPRVHEYTASVFFQHRSCRMT